MIQGKRNENLELMKLCDDLVRFGLRGGKVFLEVAVLVEKPGNSFAKLLGAVLQLNDFEVEGAGV